ncbi:hypothetical protein PanWU01x14_041400 [Parasponia andersonii]|uniref:LRR domain containing protein n=1 Tax=Parasponia andersonii TaxID=3476 RepID=A0A2P5DQE0_PARAD|nr:hypothetical protein PanWU01x14_041400 [Parasponia andersonii]
MEDVHIAAPSLEDLLIDQNPNPASLNMSGCKSNLRNLCICHFRVTDVWIQENLSGLRLLENFEFGGFLIDRSIDDTLVNEPKHNKLYFDSLKDLNLSVTSELLLSSILEIEALYLDCFTYECDEIKAASAPLPLFCPNLTDARLLLGTFDRNLDDPMLHKILIDLLRSFGHCETLSLSLCRDILPLPNIPFFWVLFRTYSHWRALQGSEQLLQLVTDGSQTSFSTSVDENDVKSSEHATKKPLHSPWVRFSYDVLRVGSND